MLRAARPLRAIDDVIVLSATEAVATKRIIADDPYMAGHFPDQPIYPGVFVVESVHQAMDAVLSQAAGVPRTTVLTAVRSLRLLAALVPGDVLTIQLRHRTEPTGVIVVSAACSRAEDVRAAQVDIELSPDLELADPPEQNSEMPAGPCLPPESPTRATALMNLLPQRHPMLLLDRIGTPAITADGPGSTMWGLKAVTTAEPCYVGLDAYGGDLYPATLLLESFLQSAAVLWVSAVPQAKAGTLVLGGVRQVEFPAPARPGDVVRHRLRLDTARGGTAFLSGYTEVIGVPDRPVLIAESVIIARRQLTTPDAQGVAAPARRPS